MAGPPEGAPATTGQTVRGALDIRHSLQPSSTPRTSRAVQSLIASVERSRSANAACPRRNRPVSYLPADERGEILDVIGHEAAERGLDQDGNPNRLGRALDELTDALGLNDDG